jgi:hypothetical protein
MHGLFLYLRRESAMKKIVFLLPILFLLSCSSVTYIKTIPDGAKIKEENELKGVTPYFHWDRGMGISGRTFTLQLEGYKDKTVSIEKSRFVIHRIFFLPILSWPWLFEYPDEYYFELEQSEQPIQRAENKAPKQTEITKPNIPASSNLETQSKSPDSSEYAQKLRELKKLKDEGLLNDKEYEIKRNAIIDGM